MTQPTKPSLDLISLETWLWEAACKIRGPVDAPKYKDYILPLIFLKRLSDVFEDEVQVMAEELGGIEMDQHVVENSHELVRFYVPQLARAGLIHYQFEAIHPFLDGNGRVGRLLVILLLIEWGLLSKPLLYLSTFFEAYQLDYSDRLLTVSQRGEWEKWLLFFFKGVSSQSLDAVTRIDRLGKLRSVYQERLHTERAAARLLQTLDVLFERPILNIRQLEAALEVPYRTAKRYIERLEEIGIVREMTGQARNRLYRADDILAALET
jgi:Fic family protein